jgi:hypothetical protein
MEYDDYADEWICHECIPEYNKTRIWEFHTRRGDNIIVDPNDTLDGAKMIAIEMDLGMFDLSEYDNFIKLLLKVRNYQKKRERDEQKKEAQES